MDSENIKKQRGEWEKSFMWDLLLEALLLRFIPTKQERSIRIAFMNCIQVIKPIKGGYRKSPNPFLDKESCKRNLLPSTAPKESIKKGLEMYLSNGIYCLNYKSKKYSNLQETSAMVFITSMHGCMSPDEPTQVTPIHPLSYPVCQPRPSVAVSSLDW